MFPTVKSVAEWSPLPYLTLQILSIFMALILSGMWYVLKRYIHATVVYGITI
jgi:hypothetical protein